MFHVKQSDISAPLLSAEQQKKNVDVAGRNSGDARRLSYGSRSNPLQLLTASVERLLIEE